MTIPKIIHHIAPSDVSKWHPLWFKCRESWKKNFPNYKFILWNDCEDIDNFVKENYPQYWNLYNLFPVHIMRIDFVRLCILHKYGGIYADMDVFCYKNFEDYMTKEIYFLQNTTNEFTDVEYENSIMASIPNHYFLKELMKYTQTCYIHFKNLFNKENKYWRDEYNSMIVNNITGSGLISSAINQLNKHFNINIFDCEKFNNRPASYDKNFYTKHIHTSIWGNEYIEYSKKNFDRLLILNGFLYMTSNLSKEQINQFKNNNDKFEIIMYDNFDFYKDYTNGMYLKKDNLEELKKNVSMKRI
jgi:mannosyltransferase OCH1-like enzyme